MKPKYYLIAGLICQMLLWSNFVQAMDPSQGTVPDRIIHLTAQKFYFSPDTIVVKQGELVRIIATSIDVVHGFALPAYHINTNIVPNQETIIEFTANKPGLFTFFCSVYCGPGHYSMKGSLVVEEE